MVQTGALGGNRTHDPLLRRQLKPKRTIRTVSANPYKIKHLRNLSPQATAAKGNVVG